MPDDDTQNRIPAPEQQRSTLQRRGFFKEALNQLIQPVAELIDTQFPETGSPKPNRLLRPPGALPETEFLQTCHRCGNCVKNCPAAAIFPAPDTEPETAGTPYIDPDEQPCVICDSLACMYVCPTGALQQVYAEDINMGVAVFNADTCLRTKNIACTYCVDTCPIGADAIHLTPEGTIAVVPAGCTGCGVCQYACPTSPKSIVVQPTFA